MTSDSGSADRASSLYNRIVKRGLDLLCIALGTPVVLPVVALLALLVFLSDRSNPFYSQPRVGRNGRIYTIWKLRTMVPDADRLLEAYLAENAAAQLEWDTTQKLKADPRITRIGRFLRRSSLDELPQLWNVVRGDMSLVGPRPMMPEQRVLYPGRAYYRLRPGITGAWQVSERNESSFAGRARFDTAYASDVSFLTDLKLLLATFRVVLRATGY
ncbi:MAG: sugar transferase [Paracoccaceae bacterium]